MVELALHTPVLRSSLIILALTLASACDESDDEGGEEANSTTNATSESESSGESESSSGTDTTGADTSGTDTTGEPIMCPDVFPSFEKTCSVDDDCALALHTVDCCGTEVAWGIRADALTEFEAAEAVCDGQYPACDCAPQPTLAEDGQTVMDATQLAVTCMMGACTSYVP